MRLLVSLLFVIPLCAQTPPPEGGRPGGGRGPQPPKNLKVLKIQQPQEIMGIMRSFTIALGVRCDHCHVMGNWAVDDNPKKDIARKMITMVASINNGNFADAKVQVTCYTCHRGAVQPLTAPPPATPPAP